MENEVNLVIIVFEIVTAFATPFVTCEISERVNQAFNECSDMIDQLDWYLFPNKIQRMLPTIINYARKPTVLKCCGSKTCHRQTFKQVSVTFEFHHHLDIVFIVIKTYTLNFLILSHSLTRQT